MNDYYLLIGLNKKEVKITNISQNDSGIVEVSIEGKKKKVRCPLCGKFTSSIHDMLKPIRSVYLDSCGTNVDLIIYGHSHKYSYEKIQDIVYLNPGSCGKKRFSLPLSMAIITTDNGEIKNINEIIL